MADIQEVRRLNLRRLVGEHAGMNNLARALGLTKGAYISQLLTTPPVRTISEKTCRRWEKLLGLPEGWMDGQSRGRSAIAQAASTSAIDADLLERVMSVVFEELKKIRVELAPARLSELVAMHYADAASAGHVDTTRIRKIVGLLKR